MSPVYTIHFHHLHNHPTDLSLFLLESEIFGLIIFLIRFWFFDFAPPHHPQLFCPLLPHFITSLLLLGLTCPFPPQLQHLLFHSWISIWFQAPHPNSLPTSILLCPGTLFSCRKQIECGVSKGHSWSKCKLNVANSPKVRWVPSPMIKEPDECHWKMECLSRAQRTVVKKDGKWRCLERWA